jgi:hypothetical protein
VLARLDDATLRATLALAEAQAAAGVVLLTVVALATWPVDWRDPLTFRHRDSLHQNPSAR